MAASRQQRAGEAVDVLGTEYFVAGGADIVDLQHGFGMISR